MFLFVSELERLNNNITMWINVTTNGKITDLYCD